MRGKFHTKILGTFWNVGFFLKNKKWNLALFSNGDIVVSICIRDLKFGGSMQNYILYCKKEPKVSLIKYSDFIFF